jgi:hypothetical protein
VGAGVHDLLCRVTGGKVSPVSTRTLRGADFFGHMSKKKWPVATNIAYFSKSPHRIEIAPESSKIESYERDCSRADDFITDIHYYKLHIGCLRGPSEAGDGPPPRQDRLV